MARIHLAVAVAALTIPAIAASQSAGGGATTQVEPGEPCPAGMTEVRPRRCQAPTMPAPSILDYRPRSTLVAPDASGAEGEVPGDRLPRPSRPAAQLDAEGLSELGDRARRHQRAGDVAANNVSGDDLERQVALIAASPRMKDRVRVLTGIDFRNVGPGWAERAVAQLEADVAAGAVGDRRDRQGARAQHAEGRRLAAAHRRSRARSRVGRRPRGSASPSSSTRPIRRSSGSRSTTPTSAGSSSRSSRTGATRPTSSRPSSS